MRIRLGEATLEVRPMGAGFLEYKQRIVFSLLRAAARVAMRLGLPLDQMVGLCRMAYFEEAREEAKLDLGTIAELFGKSLRTVSSLHNQYRGDFFSPERDVQFRRELAGRLAQGPLTREELAAAFDGKSEVELAAAIDDLLRERRIIDDGKKLRRNPEDHHFFNEADIVGRVDGLNRQMDIVAETVWNRLIQEPAPPTAVARSYVFAGQEPEVRKLLDDLLELTLKRAIETDELATADGVNDQYGVTIAAAPLEEKP